jgi:hypothetical protein
MVLDHHYLEICEQRLMRDFPGAEIVRDGDQVLAVDPELGLMRMLGGTRREPRSAIVRSVFGASEDCYAGGRPGYA